MHCSVLGELSVRHRLEEFQKGQRYHFLLLEEMGTLVASRFLAL